MRQMFTGIIEETGSVSRIEIGPHGTRLGIEAPATAAEARIGDSVAVNGCCLTVVAKDGPRLEFDAVAETMRRTSLGSLAAGGRVNLERPLRANGRFDGHIVQGHVDGVGHLEAVTPEGSSYRLRFRAEPPLLRYVVEKGSISVEGISLTVAALGEEWFEVAIIPHTWQVTNLAQKEPGSPVNLEVDVLAKYVERLLASRA